MAIVKWNPRGFWNFPTFLDDEEFSDLTVTEGLDVYETDNDVVVEAAVPGLREKDVNVTFEDGVLRINGRREETEEEKQKKKVVHRLQKISAFDYTATLPRPIDGAKIEAEIDNGVLIVKAPIAPEAKPKKITVKARAK